MVITLDRAHQKLPTVQRLKHLCGVIPLDTLHYEDRFCTNGKGGIEGGGRVKAQGENYSG